MNEEYIDNVKQLIEQKDANKVKEFLINLHPADIAELCNDLNPEEARFVYRLLDNETAADDRISVDLGGRRIIKKKIFSSRIRQTRLQRGSWARVCV